MVFLPIAALFGSLIDAELEFQLTGYKVPVDLAFIQ